jgi:magnesium chelatase family protein
MRLARRLTPRLPAMTLLPAMSLAEATETMCLHRVADLTGDRTALVTSRPCRAPHHTISDVGPIGSGYVPMPGEVSLAHDGVLFLDELPKFRRHILEVWRQPLEEGMVTIARASMHASSLISLTLPGPISRDHCSRPCQRFI